EDACTTADTCSEGACAGGSPIDCEDGNVCTDDYCWPLTGECVYANNTDPCDDSALCTENDTCNGGACLGTPKSCDDENLCTIDSCEPGTGQCAYAVIECNDSQWCNGIETCEPLYGCQAGTQPDCSDGVNCTVDSCNEGTDSCDHAVDDSLCDDGLWCDGSETCDEQDGCQAGTDPCPDDALFCNGEESCDEEDDQCLDTGDPCPDDGLWCNGEESCDEAGDRCDVTDVPDCGDGVDCTADSCNEAADSCDNIADDSFCDDGLWCNGPETCDEVSDCQAGMEVDCDDGIPCTDDYCDDVDDQCDLDDYCADIYVDPVCPANAMAGDAVSIPVSITDGIGIDSIGFDLSFDPGVLEYNGFSTDGCLLDDWPEFNCVENSGVVSCDGFTTTPLPEISSGCLAQIEFTVLSGTEGSLTYLFISDLLEDLTLMSTTPCSLHIGECTENWECDDGLFCNGAEECVDNICEPGAFPCLPDGNDCTADYCNETDDSCDYLCNATDYEDPCCEDSACSDALICEDPCVDNDGDGFGYPGDPSCPDPREDCDDNNPGVNPGIDESVAEDNCDDGYDNDCDSFIDNADSNCESSICGTLPIGVEGSSGQIPYVLLYLIPFGFIVGMKRRMAINSE
ncbi:cohesin domain-containing protein, partial [Thermodesulfobacteriota bacterium]